MLLQPNIRARPQLPPLPCGIVLVDRVVKYVICISDSSWWAPQSLRLVAQREFVDIIVVQDPAQLGGRNQVAASLRGSQVCCTDYVLPPSGIVMKWHSALALHRVVFFSDKARPHTHLHGGLGLRLAWSTWHG